MAEWPILAIFHFNRYFGKFLLKITTIFLVNFIGEAPGSISSRIVIYWCVFDIGRLDFPNGLSWQRLFICRYLWLSNSFNIDNCVAVYCLEQICSWMNENKCNEKSRKNIFAWCFGGRLISTCGKKMIFSVLQPSLTLY